MAADVDLEASGLLDGLEGDARRERTELIGWLLDRGFTLPIFADRPPRLCVSKSRAQIRSLPVTFDR
jgi:hypothetical protein